MEILIVAGIVWIIVLWVGGSKARTRTSAAEAAARTSAAQAAQSKEEAARATLALEAYGWFAKH